MRRKRPAGANRTGRFSEWKARLSPEMALRIEKAAVASMNTLMRMQCNYDIAVNRKGEDEIEVERFATKA